MALDQNFYPDLAAYFSGNLSEDERLLIETWRKESERNEQIFQNTQAIWKNSSIKLSHPNPDVEGDWMLLQTSIKTSEGKVVPMQSSQSWLKIAASLLILAVASFLIYRSVQPDIFLSKSGSEVLKLYLPDSTAVWLNTESSLSYSSEFGKEHREVELTGEAYFSVTRDTLKPFTISTKASQTRVLGTKFNLKEDGNDVSLHVAEGKVSFGKKSKKADPVIVAQDEKAVLKDNTVEKSKNTDRNFAAWREQNNPTFQKERSSPASYIATQYTWRKNKINQSVVVGTLQSSSTVATYRNIVMKVQYTRASGRIETTRVVITDTLLPGQQINFDKRLLDIFSDTKKIVMEVEKADSSIE